MRTLRNTVAAFILGATPALSQQDVNTSVVIRSAGIAGVAPVFIDLQETSTQRFALVMGNGDYDSVTDLPNAVADARLVADTLRASGYTVSEHENLTKRGFEAAMRQMLYEAELGAELLVFYAGHSVQVGGRNYLLPTDTQISSVNDLPFETVSLQGILALAASRARSVVAIMDSCRDNPFPDKKLSVDLDGVPASIRNGFTPQESPINSLIVFSTSPGAVALDGDGDNSPFTQAMVEAVQARPEASFDDLLKDIRRNVYERTARLQLPWQSSSLVEPVYLSRRAGEADWPPAPAVSGATESAAISVSAMLNPKIPMGRQVDVNDGTVTLVSQPASGRIEVERDGRLIAVPEQTQLSAADLQGLTDRPAPQIGRTRDISAQDLTDQFSLQSAGQIMPVSVTLEVDACDREAGDHLDPEGVGIALYPNELTPTDALAACQNAVRSDPENGRFHYQLGRAHLALRQLDEAERAYLHAMSLGHTRAYQGLGLLEIARVEAIQGRLAGRASDRALGFFAAGVERGDPYAYHSLGLQFLRHPTTPDERRQGFELLSRALELGHTFSMNALGLYFLDEDAPHYDAERGIRYLQGSAAREDIYGFANLGFVFANGIGGLPKDPQQAMTLFERAAAGGHPTAPTSMGRLYFSGDMPGGINVTKAISFYDQGLERGDAWGGANAAWIIANRRSPGFAPHDAATRAAKAATLRNPAAQKAAREVLGNLTRGALDGGAQALLRDLGVEIEVDGAFGPNSQQKLDAYALTKGITIPTDRQARLLALAAEYWKQTPFRVDLY